MKNYINVLFLSVFLYCQFYVLHTSYTLDILRTRQTVSHGHIAITSLRFYLGLELIRTYYPRTCWT